MCHLNEIVQKLLHFKASEYLHKAARQCYIGYFILNEEPCKCLLTNNDQIKIQADLETWAGWLQSVVDKALKPYENKPDFTKAARQFLLRWSFYRQVFQTIQDNKISQQKTGTLLDSFYFFTVEHEFFFHSSFLSDKYLSTVSYLIFDILF